jgi:hypothetical protein
MIIFDLDGTLTDCEHRRHFVDPAKNQQYVKWFWYKEGDLRHEYVDKDTREKFQPNWPAFYEACDKDEPIESTCDILNLLQSHFDIQIWSGRCESVRSRTEYWINNHIVPYAWNDKRLKMRPIRDNTPDDVLKERWLDEAIAEGKTIDFVFDDRKKVVEMWRRRGIFVFDVSQGKGDF